MSKQKVVLHISASSFGNAALIDRWHVLPKPQGNGWSGGCGYHIVILNGNIEKDNFNPYLDGHWETGRAFSVGRIQPGAHCPPRNRDSIGICLIGVNNQAITESQKNVLERRVLTMLKNLYGPLDISQHSDWDDGKPHCAGFEKSEIQRLNRIFGET